MSGSSFTTRARIAVDYSPCPTSNRLAAGSIKRDRWDNRDSRDRPVSAGCNQVLSRDNRNSSAKRPSTRANHLLRTSSSCSAQFPSYDSLQENRKASPHGSEALEKLSVTAIT